MAVNHHFVAIHLVLFLVSVAHANEQAPDISGAWFKPSLIVNNNSRVCDPLLADYTRFFVSEEYIDPLEFDMSHLSSRIKGIPELLWREASLPRGELYVAEFTLKGEYRAFIRRPYSINWRSGFYEYAYLKEPLDTSKLNSSNIAAFIDDHPMPSFGHKGNFAVPERIFEADGNIYVVVKQKQSDPTGAIRYLVMEFSESAPSALTCDLKVAPSNSEVESQSVKLANFRQMRNILNSMMGEEGNCGTSHALSNARHSLNRSLRTLLYRPWLNVRFAYPVSFDYWGHSGRWNYEVYQQYIHLRPLIKQDLLRFYTTNYQLSEADAAVLAKHAFQGSVSEFSDGETLDQFHGLHKAILTGVDAETILSKYDGQLQKHKRDEKRPYGSESILSFAIGRPKLIAKLLAMGFDPNHTNAFSKTPLMYAAQFDELDSAKVLLEHGASTETETTEPRDGCYHTIKTHHRTALHYAVHYSSFEFIKHLINFGASVSSKDSRGNTPKDYLVASNWYSAPLSEQPIPNSRLTEKQKSVLAELLEEPSKDEKRALARQELIKGEKFYRDGNLAAAYQSFQRVLVWDADSARARNNLALVAYRLEHYGISAKASMQVIESNPSKAEKSSAYYNMGLVCERISKHGYHRSDIRYDGEEYCGENENPGGPLPWYARAFKESPRDGSRNAIIRVMNDIDIGNQKKLCVFGPDLRTSVRTLHLHGRDVWFLVEDNSIVPFRNFQLRQTNFGGNKKTVRLERKEEFDIGEGLWLVRAQIKEDVNTSNSSLEMDNLACSFEIPVALSETDSLVEVYAGTWGRDSINLNINTERHIALILYGNDHNWFLQGNTSKVKAIYLDGSNSQLHFEGSHADSIIIRTQDSVKEAPQGVGYFHPYHRMPFGPYIATTLEADGLTVVDISEETLGVQ